MNDRNKRVFNRFTDNAYLLLSGSALFWAGNFVVGRGMHELIPPLAMAWMRWTIASLLFVPFAIPYLRRDAAAIRANWPILLLLGTVGAGAFNTLAYIGLNHTTALNGLIIQSAGPILILLLSLMLFRELFSLRQLFGVFVSLSGVLLIVSRADLANLLALQTNKGDLWVLTAMAVWGFYTVMLRKRPQIHPISFIAVTFPIGALVNFPLFLYEHLFVRQFQLTIGSAATIAYISVFPSILAYLFWNRGVALIGGNRAGTFLHMVPLFGSVLAITLLGEQLHLYHVLGFALIISGVTLAARSHAKPQS